MPKTKAKKSPPPLEDLPETLRKALVRIMVKYNLDIEEAYEKLAVLADINSREYDAAVAKKSESIFKSRMMTQMNAARVSINRTANARLNNKYSEGYDAGYTQSKDDHAIYFYCAVCQKPIYVTPNSEDHKAVVKYMHEHGWGHQACHEKNI